ncbi:hypothetical protein QCA50_003458 [Cerrena zonata]|uniref:Uncharacterized protein n=1 Tax=Cerrena zonata TaxID=2478898 RepID=A0AAW0GKX7_9APHY
MQNLINSTALVPGNRALWSLWISVDILHTLPRYPPLETRLTAPEAAPDATERGALQLSVQLAILGSISPVAI